MSDLYKQATTVVSKVIDFEFEMMLNRFTRVQYFIPEKVIFWLFIFAIECYICDLLILTVFLRLIVAIPVRP